MGSDIEKQHDVFIKLIAEQRKIEMAQTNVLADQKRLQENLEKAEKARQEIEKLKPLVAEHELLEKMRDDFIEQIAQIRAKDAQIRSLDEKMNDLRGKFIKNKEQIKEVEAKAQKSKDYETLQKRDSELTRDITRFRAKLEFGEQFQTEVKNYLCLVPSQKNLNLKAGETLENFLRNQFVELKGQIETLEAEQNSTAEALKIAREAEKYLITLETLKSRETEIAEEGISYKTEKENLLKDIGDIAKFHTHLVEGEAKLKALKNPKVRIQMLEEETRRETQIREKLSKIEKNLERLDTDRRINTEILESYKQLYVEANCNVGSKCLRLAEFVYSKKICNEIFLPLIGDWRKEFMDASKKGEVFEAIFISVRNYYSFACTMIICSKFGKLIEFIMRIVEVIEFFNKFFR